MLKLPFMGAPAETRHFPKDYLRHTLGNPAYLPSRGDIILLLGYNTLKTRNLRDFGRDHKIFEYWTQEYIDGLGGYLSERVRNLYLQKKDKVTLLEVGAGDGRLTHFLKTRGLKGVDDKSDIYAVDNGDWEVNILRRFPVGRLSYQDAIEQCQPDLILSSWMPDKIDWTPEFRAASCVKEYILIGDPAICGTKESYGEAPERDGFVMRKLHELSRLQIGFNDYQVSNDIVNLSSTFSFRRI